MSCATWRGLISTNETCRRTRRLAVHGSPLTPLTPATQTGKTRCLASIALAAKWINCDEWESSCLELSTFGISAIKSSEVDCSSINLDKRLYCCSSSSTTVKSNNSGDGSSMLFCFIPSSRSIVLHTLGLFSSLPPIARNAATRRSMLRLLSSPQMLALDRLAVQRRFSLTLE